MGTEKERVLQVDCKGHRLGAGLFNDDATPTELTSEVALRMLNSIGR